MNIVTVSFAFDEKRYVAYAELPYGIIIERIPSRFPVFFGMAILK